MAFFFFDPSVLLTIFVVLIPLAFEFNKPNATEIIIEYFTNPVFLICLSLIITLEIGSYLLCPSTITINIKTKQKNKSNKRKQSVITNTKKTIDILTSGDYMVSRWYLMNGLIYHSLMDPYTGFFQSWSIMTKQYNYLE